MARKQLTIWKDQQGAIRYTIDWYVPESAYADKLCSLVIVDTQQNPAIWIAQALSRSTLTALIDALKDMSRLYDLLIVPDNTIIHDMICNNHNNTDVDGYEDMLWMDKTT